MAKIYGYFAPRDKSADHENCVAPLVELKDAHDAYEFVRKHEHFGRALILTELTIKVSMEPGE